MTLRPEAGAVVRRAAARHRSRRCARATAIAVGKISGAVGTFAHLDPSIEARRLRAARARAGAGRRRRSSSAIGTPSCCRRSRSPAASLEKFALEIRGLQKTEIGEVEEPFGKGQKGSSAMPHKRNPIGCEQIVGLARLLRGNAMAALENIALWHERDISHSSVERVILPDSFIALDHMLRRFTRIVRGMVVYPERMRENLERSRGVVFSGTRAARARASAASRASRPTSGCSATRCARSTSSATSRRCCSPTPTSRGCCRRPRSSRRSISTSSCGTSTRSSTGCSQTRLCQVSGFRQ